MAASEDLKHIDSNIGFKILKPPPLSLHSEDLNPSMVVSGIRPLGSCCFMSRVLMSRLLPSNGGRPHIQVHM